MNLDRWHEIEQVFLAVLEYPPAERGEFLDFVCANDQELRQEVEKLLAARQAAGGFLATPAAKESNKSIAARQIAPTQNGDDIRITTPAFTHDDTTEPLSPPAKPPPVPTKAETRLGPYELLKELGQGGMGAVYLARHVDDKEKTPVALKLLKTGVSQPEALRRFQHEREILANLDHPNIARLLDGGVTADGRPYFVMEYVAGAPIDEYCDGQRLSVKERLQLFRQVCAAVHCAHQNLIVHRDLTPNNILVTAAGVPKLLDFGIAKLLRPERADAHLTAAGHLLLTPAYASPEQIRGETITTASDIYSLGVILYELLTGHEPYQLASDAIAEMARVVCNYEPAKPSQMINCVMPLSRSEGRTLTPEYVSRVRATTPEKLHKQLAGDLDCIVLMALRKEAHARYTSVEQLDDDLRRYLSGLPTAARKGTFSYHALKFARRHKTGAAAATVGLLALLGGGVFAGRELRNARAGQQIVATAQTQIEQHRQRAVAEQVRADEQKRIALQALDETELLRGKAEQSLVTALDQRQQALAAQQLAETERERAERRFNDLRKLARTLLWDIHDQVRNLPNAYAARETIVQASLEYLDGATREAGNDVHLLRELAAAYERASEVQRSAGNQTGALVSQRKAQLIRQQLAAAPTNEQNLRAELSAKPAANLPVKLPTNLFNGRSRASQLPLNNLLPLAPALKPAPVAVKPTEQQAQRELAAAHLNNAAALSSKRDFAGAQEQYRKALHIYQSLAAAPVADAEDRRNLALTHKYLGALLYTLGDRNSALGRYHQARVIDESLAAADPQNAETQIDLSHSYGEIGLIRWKNGDLQGGLESYRKSLAIREAQAQADPQNERAQTGKAAALTRLGWLLTDLNDLPGAVQQQERAVATYEELTRRNTSNTALRTDAAGAAYSLGTAHARLGADGRLNLEKRREHWRQARASFQRALQFWLDLRTRGQLPDSQSKTPEVVQREINRCDAALAGLQ